MHDTLWLRCADLLKERCIPINIFDTMTRKRIERIIEIREKQLKEQNEYLEKKRKEEEARAKREQARNQIMRK